LGLLWLAGTAPAHALPVFARRYGFTCQQCHTTVPQLNAFGRSFERRGFRLGAARGTYPIAVKVQSTYSSGGSDDDADTLPKAIVDEVELLSAGSIGRNASYYFEQYAVDGGMPGRARDVWVQLDRQTNAADAFATNLHVRAGEFTLPLPLDPETQRPTLESYALYSQTVGKNAFTLFDPRVGTDLFVTNDRNGLEAHLVLAQAYDRAGGVASNGIDEMAALSKTAGPNIVTYVYRYQGRRALLPQQDVFYRQGYAASATFGKFDATALVQQGSDSSADGSGLGALSSGGFLQAGWHFSSAINLYARYDDTYDPFALRHTETTLSLILRPARNMRFTVEGTHEGDGANQLALGWLFAY
jgi:hypothetical protein